MQVKTGRFQPGKTGNPKGRPHHPEELRALAKGASLRALEYAMRVMDDESEPTKARLTAAVAVLRLGHLDAPRELLVKPIQALTQEEAQVTLRRALEMIEERKRLVH